jgi:hypothetical protein
MAAEHLTITINVRRRAVEPIIKRALIAAVGIGLLSPEAAADLYVRCGWRITAA